MFWFSATGDSICGALDRSVTCDTRTVFRSEHVPFLTTPIRRRALTRAIDRLGRLFRSISMPSRFAKGHDGSEAWSPSAASAERGALLLWRGARRGGSSTFPPNSAASERGGDHQG